MSTLDAKIILLKLKNKDKDAYAQFYDLYVDRIYRFIFFKVNSEIEAQDLTSEVFLKLWQYLKDEKEIKNLNALVYTIARNKIIDFYRQKSKKEENEEALGPDHHPIIDEKIDLKKERELDSDLASILGGLKNLKDEYKEVLVLRFLDELSISEISEVLKKPNLSIRVLIHRATKALKENVQESKND